MVEKKTKLKWYFCINMHFLLIDYDKSELICFNQRQFFKKGKAKKKAKASGKID